MIGTTISHYRILEEVGRGGMGMVYKAVDTRLDREVALKFLPPGLSSDPDAKARFIQEAKAASSLDHANICTVYDIGEADDGRMFIAMALYSGGTLKDVIAEGPQSVDRTISIALQVAGALERAHGRGIVHRDIKPANIMLTKREEVKILDFGLAKLSGGVDLTKTGSTVGTAAYMSPEQVRALPADFKSDLWSLGVIMYELLTGTRPFKGEYDAAVGYSILNESPPTPSATSDHVPSELEALIFRLLAKDPNERPSGAGEVASALDEIRHSREALSRLGGATVVANAAPSVPAAQGPSVVKWAVGVGILAAVAIVFLLVGQNSGPTSEGPPSEATRPETAQATQSSDGYSLAVLPFTDLSESGELEYFGDGMAEELRNALMGLGRLRVAARASSFFFKGKNLTPQAIGDSLSVGLVLEGTIRRVGDNLRVTAELTDTKTGFGVWSNRYDERLDDALSVQDRITREIVRALQIELSVASMQEPRMQTETEAEAYRLYLQGKFLLNGRTREGMNTAIELFQEAIRLDPQFALAYAFLAQTYAVQISWGFVLPTEVLPKALDAAEKSIEIDQGLPDGYAALGIVSQYHFDREAAERYYARSLALRPDDPIVTMWMASSLVNGTDVEEGIRLFEKAYELDPLSIILGMNWMIASSLRGNCARAEAELPRLRALHGDHDGLRQRLGECYESEGRFNEAIELLKTVPDDPTVFWTLGRVYARLGRVADAIRIVEYVESNRQNGYYPIAINATIFAWLGDVDRAVELFEIAYDEKDSILPWLQNSPLPAELRNDPRFQDLIGRMK